MRMMQMSTVEISFSHKIVNCSKSTARPPIKWKMVKNHASIA